jgi:hypothetical protein
MKRHCLGNLNKFDFKLNLNEIGCDDAEWVHLAQGTDNGGVL